ncbi:MAG: hypothetical protein F6K58_27530 [Symploca sp. SIO2E9]|nr:hypothetical protein [Symploca sp. SIO2E9]
MVKIVWKACLLTATLTATLASLSVGGASAQPAEVSINEDALNTASGVRWGGKGWPFSEVVDIKDSLVGASVGRVVLDRYGSDKSEYSSIFRAPFASPLPKRLVIISLWGSKIEGCFVELLVQYAPPTEFNPESIVPVSLEMGVAGRIVSLTPQSNKTGRYYTQAYSYKDGEQQISANWHMGRQIFSVDAVVATALKKAPQEQIRARITFTNGESVLYLIGKETISRWQNVYSANPTCTAP